MSMDPDKKKDLIKTVLIAGFFLLLALIFLHQVMGDAMEG